jgi:hypothetical protein
MVDDWIDDKRKPDPFAEPESGSCSCPQFSESAIDFLIANALRELRKKLAAENIPQMSPHEASTQNPDTTMANFIKRGIELEERQCVLVSRLHVLNKS